MREERGKGGTKREGEKEIPASHAINPSDTIVDNDPIREVGGHDEVVFHHKRGLLGVHDEPMSHD